MADFWKKTMARKMISHMLIDFFIASILFGILLFLGQDTLSLYFSESSAVQDAQKKDIEELQQWVQSHHIFSTDDAQLEEWCRTQKIQHFIISKEGMFIFDSCFRTSIIFPMSKYNEPSRFSPLIFHKIVFADGTADVYLFADYCNKYYLLYTLLLAIFCIFFWAIKFSLDIHKESAFIQQLNNCVHSIGEGQLTVKIPVQGIDELASLAQGIDVMRNSLIERTQAEMEMKTASQKLVIGMAHDLKTPLTGLLTLLEVARKRSSANEREQDLRKAYAKALELKNISNQLFEFFLINSDAPLILEKPESVESILGEYLSDLYGTLEAAGFCVSADLMRWPDLKIQINLDYASRIINNLFSNIQKYADEKEKIEFISSFDHNSFTFTLRNTISQNAKYIEGAGIGVTNIRNMMKRMGGSCYIQRDSNVYSISLTFPARRDCEIKSVKV